MTKEQVEKIIEKAFEWAWEDFCFKPPEFYSSDIGRQRFREYIERGVYSVLEEAGIEVPEP